MPDYRIIKPCRPDGIRYMETGTIELSERQARYLVLSGHLAEEGKEAIQEMTKTPAKAQPKTAKKNP